MLPTPRLKTWLLLILLLPGCALIANYTLTQKFGEERVQERQVTRESDWGQTYTDEVEPILEQRCAVCHGCYDAPCQLQLTSTDGIDRGASSVLVYNGTRLLPEAPTRLGVDADSTEDWRQLGFYPVLNERQQTPQANREAGLLYQLLALKQQHPLPDQRLLPESFTLGTQREQQCSTAEQFPAFAREFPLWGMPYGLPALTSAEHNTLTHWLDAGAPLPATAPLDPDHRQQVRRWEQRLNGDSLRAQLVNRYLYEHLFLAHLYFDEQQTETDRQRPFFRLVRSRTPPGEPIDIIATRRPYDDPGRERVYYRLQQDRTTPLAKTRMPYALNAGRWEDWQQWFYRVEYQVDQLPGYQPEDASNPFQTFQQLPVQSRYRFMLAEAEYTIDGFIKGPVCRGQVALNVIRDRFWVFFTDPDSIDPQQSADFLAEHSQHLQLPAASGNTLRPLTKWVHYSKQHTQYLRARYRADSEFLDQHPSGLTTDLIWSGDGSNDNAALTIFRHFDSATVVKGLVGDTPQTAWVINYPILERIHYLLVAGFDVFGNVSHQLLTRLYMDFLRMEGEFYFLALLPQEERERQLQSWYEGAESEIQEYVNTSADLYRRPTDIDYQSDNPKQELFERLQQQLGDVLNTDYGLARGDLPASQRQALQTLTTLKAPAATLLPQITLLTIENADGELQLYSLLRNNAHSNITSLLNEDANRRPENDDITVVPGLLGTYPGAFWHLREDQLPAMVSQLQALTTEADYRDFMDRYGIRRTDQRFWPHSDRVHQWLRDRYPVDYGLLDYNRLENR